MEKRISSTEYRLGIYNSWPIHFQNIQKKFYTDSLRINLLLNQIFNIIQKQSHTIIPNSIINVYINNKILNINFGYFKLEKYKQLKKEKILFEEEETEETIAFSDSDNLITKNILPLLKKTIKNKKIRKNSIQIYLKKNIKKNKKITKIEKKYRKKLMNLTLILLHEKWNEFILEQIFFDLFKKNTKIHSNNLNLSFLKNYGKKEQNVFFFIKEWYKKIGGNLFNFNKQFLHLHYSLIYKNFTNLALFKLKNELEQDPFKQKNLIQTFYNLILAYSVIQRNITGFKITFKGTIGKHGRTKTIHFFFGRLYTFELIMPVEYNAINVNTIFGSIGIRWWLGYLEEYNKSYLDKLKPHYIP